VVAAAEGDIDAADRAEDDAEHQRHHRPAPAAGENGLCQRLVSFQPFNLPAFIAS